MKRSFTLIELMMVIGIAVLLAAVTVPGMRGIMADQRLRGAAEDVKLLLENSRHRAADNGDPVIIARDDERLPEYVECTMNSERTIVYPDGRIVDPETAGPAVIQVTDERGLAWRISTAGTCGAITLSKP